MTTEDDFQNAIDAHPEDWQTRLVFADWLDERGDPRAEGVRALVAIGRRALPCQMASEGKGKPGPINFIYGSSKMNLEKFKIQYALCFLPTDWFDLLTGSLYESSASLYWLHYRARCEADDAAALAFAKLPSERRAELLNRRA